MVLGSGTRLLFRANAKCVSENEPTLVSPCAEPFGSVVTHHALVAVPPAPVSLSQ